METDESTPLRVTEPERSYVYMSARNRVYRSKVRQFQCCICAGLLGVFVLAMIITVAYMVNHDVDDQPSELETNSSTITPLQELKMLLMSPNFMKDTENLRIPVSGYNSVELNEAFIKAEADVDKSLQDEKNNPAVPLPPNHPSNLHQKVMYSSPNALKASKTGQIILAATKNIYKDKWTTGGWTGRGPKLPSSKWVSSEWCPAKEDVLSNCDPASPYRTIDGTCNNLVNPEYGVTMKPFRRLMPPAYGDGISSPRVSTGSKPLPSAREVSIIVHRPTYKNDPHFTVVLAVWGQFVDHDFTATALSRRADGQAITCCNTVWQHPECFPVPLSAGDPFYHQYNITCMDFVRSAPAPSCSLGPREQFNQVTPYIDGSVVYGADKNLESELRTFTDGLLVSSRSADGRELLPVDRTPKDGCNQAEEAAKGRYCFKSGDARANENLHLTTLHLIFSREHNRLATELKKRNPTWSDEKLYQEARKIVGAEMQHVHYNEFLPVVLGKDLANDLNITSEANGYYHGYDPTVNPQIANEFASCAFRFGHTLMQGLIRMISGDTSSEDYVQLHKMLFNPFGLYEKGYIEKTLRGATRTGMNKPGSSVSPELQGNLFKPQSGPCGLDLVSLNIQRGRDQGLPPYPAWREHCGFKRPTTFEDLEEIMDTESVDRMKTMYNTVDDIDPYTGLLSETPVTTSGILGPTATCVISDQFVRLKKGDRFWYETPSAPQAFSPAQLNELKKVSLSSLLCDNTDTLEEVQPLSMQAITTENAITPCANLPRPNLDAWIEMPSVHLVQFSGIRPRPLPNIEELDRIPRDPTEPVSRKPTKNELVVGATAVAGSVTASFDGGPTETLWDGTLPTTIPTDFINQVLPPDGEPLTPLDPALIDHRAGIIWTGSVDLIGTNRLQLTASFSVPVFMKGMGYTQKWWNGNAKVQLNVNWNTTELAGQALGDFFTPIALRMNTSDEGIGAVPILSTSTVSSMRFPVLMRGTFNFDHSEFYWNGNVTIIYPPKPKPILQMPYSGSSYWGTPYVRPPPRLVIGGSAETGSISASYDGGPSQTLWDGTFPLSIPSPFLDRKLPAGTVLPPPDPTVPVEHRGGAFWNGKVDINENDQLVLTATFSMPVFLHVTGVFGPAVQKWWSGNAEITININWNTTEIHGLPDAKYFTPLSFRQIAKFGPSHPYRFLSTTDPNSLDKTAPTPLPTFPIILQGDYNTDHSQFLWNGNVTLVFPKPTPAAPLSLLQAAAPAKQGKKVVPKPKPTKPVVFSFGGNATFASFNFDEDQIWDGSSPLNFSVPAKGVGPIGSMDLFHGGDSVFIGSIEVTAPNTISVNGSISLPIANASNPASIIWQTGTIEATLNVTWNNTLPEVIATENDTLHCLVYLSPAKSPKDKSPASENLLAAPKIGPAIMPSCFVILSGQSSLDKTSFSWSGSYVAVIRPAAGVTPAAKPSRKKRSANALSHGRVQQRVQDISKPTGHKVVLGGKAVSGKITAASDGSPRRTLFHGSLPISIPMPAFDRYLPRTTTEYIHQNIGPIFHGNGPIWSGSVNYRPGTRTIELYGDFRVPLYLHGNTFKQEWWLGHAELVIDVAWNNTLLDYAAIASLPDADFYSPIRFRPDEKAYADDEAYNSIQMSDPDMMIATPMQPPDEPFYPKGPMPKFPIILHGAMNSDGRAFLWNGNMTMVFPYAE
ncbi:uncharacterized protein LOC135947188 [Cloeon dipterum]|uniref:uncharacterized protein LOC135947188 n=1 Tax=Cloeon dipterum TaxID=197152 RepID=UPI00321F6729